MATVAIAEPTALPTPLPNHDALYEVVSGEYVELPPMGIYSTWIAGQIFLSLGVFLQTERLGRAINEGLFILDRASNLRRRPDVAFVAAARWPLDRPLPETGDWEVVPDLAIEVVSPNDLMEDVVGKVLEYFRHGVQQVWAVLPSHQQVYIYEAPTRVHIVPAPDELEGGPLLPGYRLPLATLFAGAR